MEQIKGNNLKVDFLTICNKKTNVYELIHVVFFYKCDLFLEKLFLYCDIRQEL